MNVTKEVDLHTREGTNPCGSLSEIAQIKHSNLSPCVVLIAGAERGAAVVCNAESKGEWQSYRREV